MSQTSDRYAVLVIAIVRTLADKYGFDETEALDIVQNEVKRNTV